jgi:hypothetical protein
VDERVIMAARAVATALTRCSAPRGITLGIQEGQVRSVLEWGNGWVKLSGRPSIHLTMMMVWREGWFNKGNELLNAARVANE